MVKTSKQQHSGKPCFIAPTVIWAII